MVLALKTKSSQPLNPLRAWCVLALLVVVLAGCGIGPNGTINANALILSSMPPLSPTGAKPAPLRMGKLVSNIRNGQPVGTHVFGLACWPPFSTFTWSTVRHWMAGLGYREQFYGALADAGFDVAGAPTKLYDEEEDEARAELTVHALIIDLKASLCRDHDWLTKAPDGESGSLSVTIEWVAYSRLVRRPIYKVVTSGRAETNQPRYGAAGLLMEEAFGRAAVELSRDPGFRAAVHAPDNTRPRSVLQGPGKPDPTAPQVPPPSLTLASLPLRTTTVAKEGGEVVAATVVVGSGTGHGSGFFIGQSGDGGGLLVTNNHVVGDSERVRVVLADGTPLIGLVDRRHRIRDVALVRLDQPPPAVLSIRQRPLVVGEPVHAIGAPMGEKMRGTFTHGVVSAFRRDPLTGLDRIQADVMIQHGSSGGPLVDEAGNVVGLCFAGMSLGAGPSMGLNFFIPIMDALDKLDITLRPAAASAVPATGRRVPLPPTEIDDPREPKLPEDRAGPDILVPDRLDPELMIR
ncbi:Serine protease [uncultured Gammaproteobacteria bacterium]